MNRRSPLSFIILTMCAIMGGVAFLIGSVGGGGGGGATGTVSGAVFIGDGQVLDSDTKDPNNPQVDNDSDPQALLIPATVGGNADSIQDRYDVYRVRLDGPATFVLAIADPLLGDLDLRLTETDGTVIEESLGTGPLESIESGAVPSGEYHVIVEAYSGSSNYVLSLGISAGVTAMSALMASSNAIIGHADWVSDEIIVKFRSGTPAFQSRSDMSALAGYHGITPVASTQSALALMKVQPSDLSPYLRGQQAEKNGTVFTYSSEESRMRARTLKIIKALNDHPAVAYAEPNYISRISLAPDDPFYGFQWHYPAVNLPQAWDITTGDDSVVVGIIDTGVLINHPDLAGRILRDGNNKVIGYDFISDRRRANDGNGIDPNPDDSGDLAFGDRSSFHGTHVAGTVAAATGNSIGVAGVTWQGKIMPLRVLGIDGGTDFDIAQSILYAAGEVNVSGTVPPVKADVINLSLGPSNPTCSPLPPIGTTLKEAVEKALAAGVIVVVAAGNDSCDVPSPLSTVDGVITVSATDIVRQRAPYSNFGATIDVAAPGGNAGVDLDADGIRDGVISTLADDGGSSLVYEYGIYQGTSMAAPHAAGVFALMRAVNQDLTPDDINRLLDGSLADPNKGPITIDIGDPGPDDLFGFGLIDAFAAVNIANSIEGGGSGNAPPDEPVLSVLPERLNFSFTSGVLQIAISNPGTADLEVTAITGDAAWLSVDAPATPFTIPAGSPTAAILTVSVDRSGLFNGTYLGSIAIATSNAGNRTVPVSMQVQTNIGGDVGVVYVLVVDPETLETVAQTETRATDGYTFRTPRVPAGTYLIAAGTDKDNDRSVCDAGEACGLFPLVDNPAEVDVSGDISDIDFAVVYELFATNSALQDLGTGDKPFDGFRRMDVKGLSR